MRAILRQYVLVLWVIVSRPWTLLMLGLGGLCVGPFLTAWIVGRAVPDGVMTPVPVVDGEPLLWPSLGALARSGRVAELTEWSSKWEADADFVHIRGDQRGGAPATLGSLELLDRLPMLEKLWLMPPAMLSQEGWRRIGEHSRLEVLSLPNVPSTDSDTSASFLARAALERLSRLRQLDLRGTGGALDLLLPRLSNLEVLAVGSGRLEENLRTLADGSPRLRILAIQTWADLRFTPAMIASLKRMPDLRRVSVEGATHADDESAMQRQVAELRRALPGVAVDPGTYRSSRVWAAFWATVLGAYLPFTFWFQSSLLLSTSLAWMLPRRFAPHLFWATAVAVACGGVIVAVLVSVGVAWIPAITIASFTTMLLSGGAIGDVEGIAGRISSAVPRVELVGSLAFVVIALLSPWIIDRWLSGTTPRVAAIMLAAIVSTVAWKVLRQARLPRILTSLQMATPPGLVIDGTQGAVPQQNAGRSAGWQTRLAEWGIDRQIDKPVPAPYLDMLRRPQWRLQVPLTVAVMSIGMVGGMLLIPLVVARGTGQPPPTLSRILPGLVAAFAWQASVMAIAQTTVLWGQRRGSLVLDFLRPVSRAGYWRALRQAIARDLILPGLLGAGCIAMALALSTNAGGWAWCVSVMVLVGIFVMTHAMILLLAVTRWPLVVGTLMIVLLVAAGIGAAIAFTHVLSVSKPADLHTALAAAGGVLAVGLGVRGGALWRLEEREIG